MSQQVDVAIAFYGKPYQTIVAIKSLLEHSRQHIDKLYISCESRQPHNDWSGIHKVMKYFRNSDLNIVLHYPHYFLAPDAHDTARAVRDTRYRHSIMFQYALEQTDKQYLCVMHNDMLFHDDMIGAMLNVAAKGSDKLAGIGSIGQCWSCPAAWANRCGPLQFEQYVPTREEAVALHQTQDTPRRDIDLQVINAGRVHPLPECRLNEYSALINVPIYRRNTLPTGTIGCYGGGWKGADLGTVWFHDMFHRGYTFKHVKLETYAKHAPFEPTGYGSGSYTRADRYWLAEEKAAEYIDRHYGKPQFGLYVPLKTQFDALKRQAWLALIHSYGLAKKIVAVVR